MPSSTQALVRDPAAASAPSRRMLVFGAALTGMLLYGLTAAPGLLWQDSALFQFRVWHFDAAGIEGLPLAHPLYILLARAFAWLPLGADYAFRVNLFSAAVAAIGLAFFIDLLLSLTNSRTAALVGTALLGVSHTYWTHAVIAEVYGLYSLGLVIELWILERFLRRSSATTFALLCLVNGLNLSNHLMALLHLPAYAGLFVWTLRNGRLRGRHLPMFLAAWLVGTTPYLWLIAGEIAAGEPVMQTLWYALVGPPKRSAIVMTVAFPIGRQLLRAVQFFAMNFPTPLALLAPFGIWAAWRRRSSRPFIAVILVVFATTFVFALRYLVPDQFVFFTPCYLLFAVFIAMGVAEWTKRRNRRILACALCAILPVAAYEIAPALVKRTQLATPFARHIPYRDSYSYFLRPRKNGETSASQFARAAFARAAPDGLLIADRTVMNALIYARDVQGIGRGVTLHRGDIPPAPPAIELTPEALRPFAETGRAYICGNAERYVPPWIRESYELTPAAPIFKLAPANGQ